MYQCLQGFDAQFQGEHGQGQRGCGHQQRSGRNGQEAAGHRQEFRQDVEGKCSNPDTWEAGRSVDTLGSLARHGQSAERQRRRSLAHLAHTLETAEGAVAVFTS